MNKKVVIIGAGIGGLGAAVVGEQGHQLGSDLSGATLFALLGRGGFPGAGDEARPARQCHQEGNPA